MKLISVTSYNILAQRFNDNKEEWCSWDKRKEIIFKQIRDINSDIFCLQEVELDSFEDDFSDLLKELNYNYVRHQISRDRTSPIGNVTMWKSHLSFDNHIYKSSALIHTFIYMKYYESVDVINTKSDLQIVNLHLHQAQGPSPASQVLPLRGENPSDFKAGYNSGEQIRLSQLTSILKSCTAKKVVICGDFNDDLKSEGKLYQLLLFNGYTVCEQINPTCMISSSKNTWVFDRVVSTGKITIEHDPVPEIIEEIPNILTPSDHLPITFRVISS